MSEIGSQNNSDWRRKKTGSRSVSEILGKVLEPVIARRTGMTLDLYRIWPEICGPEFAQTTRPQKIVWPRRAHEEDPFQPATLVVACEPSAALFFQHEHAAILERTNRFFGFDAVKAVRIVQKPVSDLSLSEKPNGLALTHQEEAKLQELIGDVEDPELRERLEKLGRGVIISNRN